MISVQVIIGSDIYKTFMKVKKNHGSFTFGQNEKYNNTKHSQVLPSCQHYQSLIFLNFKVYHDALFLKDDMR